jgi:hypothetical protein
VPPVAPPPDETAVDFAKFGDPYEREDYIFHGTNEQGEKVFVKQFWGSNAPKDLEPYTLRMQSLREFENLDGWVALKIHNEAGDLHTFDETLPANTNGIFVEGCGSLERVAVQSLYDESPVECYVKNLPKVRNISVLGKFGKIEIGRLGIEGKSEVSITFGPTPDGKVLFAASQMNIEPCPAVTEVHAGEGVSLENLLRIARGFPGLKRLYLSPGLRQTLADDELAQVKTALPAGCTTDF